jgi:hypothetical protein
MIDKQKRKNISENALQNKTPTKSEFLLFSEIIGFRSIKSVEIVCTLYILTLWECSIIFT